MGEELHTNLSSVIVLKNNIDVEYYKNKIIELEK